MITTLSPDIVEQDKQIEEQQKLALKFCCVEVFVGFASYLCTWCIKENLKRVTYARSVHSGLNRERSIVLEDVEDHKFVKVT